MSIRQPVPGYAWRSPGSSFTALHQAVDVPAPCGTPVVAVADGVVRSAGYEATTGGGNVVKLAHRVHPPISRASTARIQEALSVSAHLSSIAPGLSAGTLVRAGDPLGQVGQTGHAFGCHLHFGFQVDGIWRDYRTYLAGAPLGGYAVDASGLSATAGNVGPLQAIFTGDKLVPLKTGQTCTPPYVPAAVNPQLAGLIGLNVLTGWAGTTPFDQLKPQSQGAQWEWANACVIPGAFTAGDEANKVGIAEQYGLLGSALAGLGTIVRDAGLLIGLVVLLLLGVWLLVRSPGAAGGASIAVA